MANKKFSEFELKTTTSNVSHIVGYNGAENVRITPANFLDTTGGPYLPLAGGTMTGNVLYQDSVQIQLGNSADLLIFHDGADSFIKDNGTGDLYIRGNDNIYIQDTSTERFITCNSNASVDLFHNDLLRLQTTSTGISVTGNVFVNRDGTNGTVASPYFENIIESGISSTNLSAIQLGNSFGQDSGTLLRFRVNSGAGSSTPINALTIDGSGNSTFAGSITSGAGDNFDPIIRAGRTASAPAYSFTGDLDTGMFNPNTSNTVAFATGGSEKMRLNSSGNLGIGTSSPTDIIDIAGAARFTSNISFNTAKAGRIYKASNHGLALQGVTGTENDFAIFTPTGALKIVIPTGTTNLVLNPANGNVGIGTSSPNSKFQVGEATNFAGALNALVDFVVDASDNTSVNNVLNLISKFDGSPAAAVGSGPALLFSGGIGDAQCRTYAKIIGRYQGANQGGLEIQTQDDADTITTKLTINRGSGTEPSNVTVNAGDLVIATSGKGILLGGTGDANRLDDYEEGTWTPTLGGTWTTDPTNITGTYTKIGQLVSITVQFTGGAKTSSTSGYFESLPFSVSTQGTGSLSDSGVADRGNCLFANTDRVWLTSTSFGSGANYLSGTYHTAS